MDKKALYKLSHGMYVLTTVGGGCFVDAVCQVSAGDNPLVSVAVMKKNHTNALMHQNEKFALSIFGTKDDPAIIQNWGFHSSKDFDKYASSETKEVNGIQVVSNTTAYLVLEKVDTIENDTHTIFIGKVVEAVVNNDDKPMTYGYYQENKNDLMKVKTEQGKTAWVCQVCGYVVYAEELPDDFTCPICMVGKENFKKEIR